MDIYKRNELPSSYVSQATDRQIYKRIGMSSNSLSTATDKTIQDPSKLGYYSDVHAPQECLGTTAEEQETEYMPEVRYEDKVEKLLDSLGPRYTDWA